MPKKEDLKNEVDDNKEEVSKEVINETETKTKEKKASKKETKKVESNAKENKTSKEPEVDEATVIEKIKNFIAKIVAMQEEAAREESKEESESEEKKKKTTSKKSTKEEEKPVQIEYYDLPYRYNETIVKVLAQTPKKLFVYWDLADADRQKYIDTFGDDFFYKTYPVLLVYNEDKQYVREIPINDFANSWYIEIDDPKTNYIIQLGRKFINQPQVDYNKVIEHNIILRNDYIPISDSNKMESPNDHVLLESLPDYIRFRNVKTNQERLVKLRSLRGALGKVYNVRKFYDDQYKDELTDDMFDMQNPSSSTRGRLSSSQFK